MTKLNISLLFGLILIFGNTIYFFISVQNYKSRNEQIESKIEHINDFWIEEQKLKDSISFSLYMVEQKNQMLINNDQETSLSLMVYVPDKACWECVKSKIELINNMGPKIPVQLFCSPRIKRRIILMLAQGEYEDIFRVSNNSSGLSVQTNMFYFAFRSGENIFFFVDILSTNDFLESFLDQIKNHDFI